tara:strand:- start:146 stop:418 length:273 start_codon:yes stop_codon:yes gene_type:complete
MNKNYEKWLEYYKKEQDCEIGALKLHYRRLKELYRDQALIKGSIKSQFDSAMDTKNTLLDYVNTEIGLTLEKVDKIIGVDNDDEKPNFYD